MSLLDGMKKLFSNGGSDNEGSVCNTSQLQEGANVSYLPAAAEPSYPAVNLWEDDDFVYAAAMVPGQKLSDLDISVTVTDDDSHLTIKGNLKAVKPSAVWHLRERGFGSFQRTIELPIPTEAKQADAVLDDGVLTIKMAKSPEAKPRKIPVKTAGTQSPKPQK